MKFIFVAFCLFITIQVANCRVLYHGHRVVRLRPINSTHVNLLKSFLATPTPVLDLWTHRLEVEQFVDVRIARENWNKFIPAIKAYRLPFSIVVPDLQQLIYRANREAMRRSPGSLKTSEIVGKYVRTIDLYAWMDSVCKTASKLASCSVVGYSFENRTIKMITIGSKQPKRGIFLQGGIHAREWLSPASLVYIIDKFLTGYQAGDSVAKLMLDTYDWHFVIVSNPDGYEYTFTDERMWRKTRSKTGSVVGCKGVDGNRNYDYHYGEGSGASHEACNDEYVGSKAFSENETTSLAKAVLRLSRSPGLIAFFSIHTYSQLWMLPYGYQNNGPHTADYEELLRVCNIGITALTAVNGTKWQCGNVADILYSASGTSMDWVKGVAQVKYSFSMELRPQQFDSNGWGFVIPESQITPSGEELYAGLTAAVAAMQGK